LQALEALLDVVAAEHLAVAGRRDRLLRVGPADHDLGRGGARVVGKLADQAGQQLAVGDAARLRAHELGPAAVGIWEGISRIGLSRIFSASTQ
jgi:hypothetical protein